MPARATSGVRLSAAEVGTRAQPPEHDGQNTVRGTRGPDSEPSAAGAASGRGGVGGIRTHSVQDTCFTGRPDSPSVGATPGSGRGPVSASGGIRTPTTRHLMPLSLPLDYGGVRAAPGIRTRNIHFLKVASLPVGVEPHGRIAGRFAGRIRGGIVAGAASLACGRTGRSTGGRDTGRGRRATPRAVEAGTAPRPWPVLLSHLSCRRRGRRPSRCHLTEDRGNGFLVSPPTASTPP